MHNAYVLVGLPGVGKSTWLANLPNPGFIASSDNFIQTVAYLRQKTYNEVFPDSIKRAEAHFWELLEGCNEDVYIDRTNLTVKSRARLFKALPNHKFTAVVFPIPDNWAERLASRPDKRIPEHILRQMDRNYQPPTLDEGFYQIIVDPCGPQ